jgi:hypothetical protein
MLEVMVERNIWHVAVGSGPSNGESLKKLFDAIAIAPAGISLLVSGVSCRYAETRAVDRDGGPCGAGWFGMPLVGNIATLA